MKIEDAKDNFEPLIFLDKGYPIKWRPIKASDNMVGYLGSDQEIPIHSVRHGYGGRKEQKCMKFEIVGQEAKKEEAVKVRAHIDEDGNACFQAYAQGDWSNLCWIKGSGEFRVSGIFQLFKSIGITRGN